MISIFWQTTLFCIYRISQIEGHSMLCSQLTVKVMLAPLRKLQCFKVVESCTASFGWHSCQWLKSPKCIESHKKFFLNMSTIPLFNNMRGTDNAQVLHLVTLITSVSLDITRGLTSNFNHSHCNRETKMEQ